MGESQSRYSIVERLSNKKLTIMDEKLRVGESIERLKTELAESEQELVQWRKEIKEQVDSKDEKKQQELVSLRATITSLQKQAAAKEKLADEKLKELDAALEAIQNISAGAE